MGLTFPKSRRLCSPAEFRKVYDAKRSARDGRIILFVLANNLGHPRLGISVGRKLGNAVVRNRWKRLAREAFRLHQYDLPACDYVVQPRIGVTAEFDEVRDSLLTLAKQLA